MSEEFSHMSDGKADMVDISAKKEIYRSSRASGVIELTSETVEKVSEGEVVKGNVLATARVAAIQAVKKTWSDVPMCHQIDIDDVSVDFSFRDRAIESTVEVKSTGKTGVEMEALNGVSRALLTVWDMVKSAEKDEEGQYPETRISDIEVEEKVKEEKDKTEIGEEE
ncbi:MAG: cyclic pyranopterin monophosphate synthase MoaC [Halobacteria archaeon]